MHIVEKCFQPLFECNQDTLTHTVVCHIKEDGIRTKMAIGNKTEMTRKLF